MAKFEILNGATSNSFRAKIYNSSVSTGAGLTGLTSTSSGLIISTIASNEATATAYTAAGSTIDTITTLGTFAAPSAGHCRFKEVDSTNHPGLYEVQIADARFAVSGAKGLIVTIIGATNAAQCDIEFELTATNNQDGVRGGMTSLPNAAAAASGGLLTVGTGAGQINPDGSGNVPIKLTQTYSATPTANTVGESLLISGRRGRTNTAQAGAAGTITLDAGASATAGAYVGDQIYLNSGTGGGLPGTGQLRTIIGYNTSTKVATVDRNWDTNPDATTTFYTIPRGKSDTFLFRGTLSGGTAGYVGVDWGALVNGTASINLSNTTISTSQNVNNVGGSVLGSVSGSVGGVSGVSFPTNFSSMSIDGSGRVDIGKILGTASTGTAGYVGIDWSHVNAPTSTVGLTGTTISSSQVVASVSGAVGSISGVTFPTGFSSLTTTAIATSIWTDATGSDFTAVSSIGKSLYTSGVIPGAAGGHFISGSNTTTTVNFTGNLSGSVGSVTGAVGSVTGLTTATIATAVWTDTTGSDFATASSPGKILVTQVGGAFTSTSSSVFSIAALANGPSGSGSSPAAIATAVWQDLIATSDFTTNGSIGKLLATYAVAPTAAAIAAAILVTPGNLLATDGSGNVTAGTVNDKLGYSLATSQTFSTTGAVGTVNALGSTAQANVATAVWDASQSAHLTAGTTGLGQSVAASYADPWSVIIPASYGAGTAGFILGTNLNATITSRPTAVQNATAVWTDTTGSDFTTTSSPGKILVAQLGGAFSSTSSSVFSTASLANAPAGGGGGGGASASAIATAVWEDLFTGGDFGTAGSVGSFLANLSTTPLGVNVVQVLGEAATTGPPPPTLQQITAALLVNASQPILTDANGRMTLTPAGLDAVVVETGLNARQALSAITAAAAGTLSGMGTTTITISGAGVGATRIVATLDGSGNRTAVALTLPT